jgi:hypothetical protein
VIAGLAIAGLVYTFKDPYRKAVFKDAITSSKKMVEKYSNEAKTKVDQWKSTGMIKNVDYKRRRIVVDRNEWNKPTFNDFEKFKLCRYSAIHIAKENKDHYLRIEVYAMAKDMPRAVKVAKYNGNTGYREDREKVDFGQLLNN